MGWRARPGPDMAALYACTKCHQRFPFEALSQGQQLCKVRGLGRRPGAGTLEARPGAPGSAGSSGGSPGQGVAGLPSCGAAPALSGAVAARWGVPDPV